MAIGKGKMTLQDVHDNFSKYNFIITTNDFTIDTTKYVKSLHKQSEQITGALPASSQWIVMSSKDVANMSATDIVAGERRIIIFEKTVQEIKIKSRKNFLTNGGLPI